MVCRLEESGGSSARQTAIAPGRSHPISSTRTSPLQSPTRNGEPTSPTSGRQGWLYLAVVIDLFARRVVGWAIGDRLHRELALAALRKAVAMRRPSKGLIHHSDRGSQYCSIDYQAELRRHDVCISISGKGNCYDNAMVETFFKTLKSELVWRHRLPYTCPSENRHCPLYRRVLQSDPATLGA